MSAIALAGEKLRFTVSIDVRQPERVCLRERLIDSVFNPIAGMAYTLLLEPIQPVAVSATEDKVDFPILVHVIANDRESGITQFPLRMPFPLIIFGVYVLQPAVRSKNVGLAVSINVGNTNAMPV